MIDFSNLKETIKERLQMKVLPVELVADIHRWWEDVISNPTINAEDSTYLFTLQAILIKYWNNGDNYNGRDLNKRSDVVKLKVNNNKNNRNNKRK